MGISSPKPSPKGEARIVDSGNLFSPAALREVERRWLLLCRDASPSVADKFLDSVRDTAAMLAQFPKTGTICTMQSPRLSEVRRFPLTLPFGRWLLIYSVSASGILVLRVLHGSQDWNRLFS